MGVMKSIVRRGRRLRGWLLGKCEADAHAARVATWYRSGGNDLLFREHDLHTASLVVDAGGYRGEWSAEIFARYGSTIHLLEPVPQFVQQLEQRFGRNSKITIHPFALGNRNEWHDIYINEDGSSMYQEDGEGVRIKVVRASEFFRSFESQGVDLLKINVEGAEYDLVEDLLNSGLIECVRKVQVQFHDFVPGATERMRAIQNRLSRTHELVFQYEFVWEAWQRKRAVMLAAS